jgi:hypothetical protein
MRSKKLGHWVHFYTKEYNFQCVWASPAKYLSLFKRFAGVITPDFCMYTNAPRALQIWSTYRNRAIAYWLQNNGVPTVLNVRWGDERTFDFAFEGLPTGGSFAVGTYGCIEDVEDRYYFRKGLSVMLERLRPDVIVNYCEYSEYVFAECEERGVRVLTLDCWPASWRRHLLKRQSRAQAGDGCANIYCDEPENFMDTDDFVDCMNRGCELDFDFGGKSYFAGFGQDQRFSICETKPVDNEVEYDTAEAMLDHPIGDMRLRDILEDMTVTGRTVPSAR